MPQVISPEHLKRTLSARSVMRRLIEKMLLYSCERVIHTALPISDTTCLSTWQRQLKAPVLSCFHKSWQSSCELLPVALLAL